MSFGKWIGGALGWAVGGPIGGLLGFAFGYMMDDKSANVTTQDRRNYNPRQDPRYQSHRHHTRPGDFAGALLVLSASVMKADGKHMRSELDFIREFFKKQFGENAANAHMNQLKELLNKDIPLKEVCDQIRYFMEHSMRLQLVHYLYGVAHADGQVVDSEIRILEQIAHYLGVSQKDADSLKAMFYKSTSSSYKVLEIDEQATDEEVKKAYRKMAMKFHPDKVRGLGELHEKAAAEKFRSVQDAYETIKEHRGMK